jgi:hypothetical protein
LFVDLIWRNLLYIPVERETLFRVSLDVTIRMRNTAFKRSLRKTGAGVPVEDGTLATPV